MGSSPESYMKWEGLFLFILGLGVLVCRMGMVIILTVVTMMVMMRLKGDNRHGNLGRI